MIRRDIQPHLLRLAASFPAITVTGPRQSGKTTLSRATFPDLPYISLEAPDIRQYADEDPRDFLAQYPDGAIIDEVQRVPDLLSYLQVEIDDDPRPGRFVLTGSANFALLRSLSQSLAGRTGLLTLLPLSLGEVRRFANAPEELLELLLTGSYPAVFDRDAEPQDWYAAYVRTFVERDVRLLLNINDLKAFQGFLGLVAGRTGQVLNLSNLSSDCGISVGTVKAWLNTLEVSYLAHRLQPWAANVNKRLIKAPKLHLLDSGLICYLLRIQTTEQLWHHPLRGAIFESWVVAEVMKAQHHQNLLVNLSYYRDRKGNEVDLLLERGIEWTAVETKAGRTLSGDSFAKLGRVAGFLARSLPGHVVEQMLVFGGDGAQRRRGALAVPWSEIDQVDWGAD